MTYKVEVEGFSKFNPLQAAVYSFLDFNFYCNQLLELKLQGDGSIERLVKTLKDAGYKADQDSSSLYHRSMVNKIVRQLSTSEDDGKSWSHVPTKDGRIVRPNIRDSNILKLFAKNYIKEK